MTQTNETIVEVERKVVDQITTLDDDLRERWAKRDAETAKYLAAYDAACSLAIMIEHMECGYTLRANGPLALDAKAKLRKLSKIEGSDFFTRFARIEK